jgi:hypothetical protein
MSLLLVASVAIVLSSLSLSAASASTRIISCLNAINRITIPFRTKIGYSTKFAPTDGSGIAAFHENNGR